MIVIVIRLASMSHLQAIGVECAVRVYPTLEKGDPRSKLSKARNKKYEAAAFVVDIVHGESLRPSL